MQSKHTFALWLFLFCLISPPAMAQVYTVTDLGPLAPTAINTWGQVVGDYNGHAFMWTRKGGMRDLGIIPGGTFSRAAAINDLGVVTGTADGPGTVIDPFSSFNEECSDLIQPFVWTQRNGMQGLGTFGSSSWWDPSFLCDMPFSATAINARGMVVGYSPPGGTFQWGFLWTSADGMTGFGGSWPPTYAMGISNTGQIVGQNGRNTFVGHATWWKNLAAVRIAFDSGTDLGTLGGGPNVIDFASSANGVNDLGQVVGWSTTGPIATFPRLTSPVHAVLWTPSGGLRDLGTLPGDASSAASKVNFFGQVIGSSGNDYYEIFDFIGHYPPFEVSGRPFIWSERNGMRDLNTLIRGDSRWVLYSVTDINIWGQIVGSGTRNGQPHGFLLTPRTPFNF